MRDLIKEILGPYFFAKLFLIPAILGGIFLTKNIIHRSKYADAVNTLKILTLPFGSIRVILHYGFFF